MHYIHITGMARSGTTLIDKILGSHPELIVYSQPFPFLYRHIKKVFFQRIGYPETYYVLNDLFDEKYYNPSNFLNFLDSYRIKRKELDNVFKNMEGWSGQYTKNINWPILLRSVDNLNLKEAYTFILKNINSRLNVGFFGAKETLTEEFVEYYLINNIKIILLIRDPRDVVTSINIGKGTEFAGKHRPTLFHLRNWRKSIAIANTFKDNENLMLIKYEDLINNLDIKLNQLTRFIKIKDFPYDYFSEGIKNQDGKIWKGNSSTSIFNGVSSSSIGNYKKYLSEDIVKYIEYTCHPEMQSLGYKLDYLSQIKTYNPSCFVEPFKIKKETNLSFDMSANSFELSRESLRLRMLKKNQADLKDIIRFFYSKDNYDLLRHFSI